MSNKEPVKETAVMILSASLGSVTAFVLKLEDRLAV